jgi:trk system potassium uptake protein TrkA
MRILIVGAGDVGFQLSRRLCRERHDLTIVEQDARQAVRAREQLDAFVIEGNAASYETLRDAGLERMDIVAAMTDNDDANVMVCRMAKKAGSAMTIARVRNPEFTADNFIFSMAELGVDHIIHPEKEAADAIIRLLHESSASYAVELENGRIQFLGLYLDRKSALLNKPLSQLSRVYGNPPLRIVAISRNHRTIVPTGNDQLLAGDQVFVVCDPTYVNDFKAHAGKTDVPINNVMILGGGLIGQFVAAGIATEANVKIFEDRPDRAQQIAETLPRALVINGDGTDFDLLAAEGLSEMDALVAVTGEDEKNIITTLLARHLNVPRAIGLVNKVEYLPITSSIGMDAVVSKQVLTVNAVQRFIHHQQVASIASLPGINAQLIEYVAAPRSRITRKALKDLRFPEHAVVGAILHEDRYVVPNGETRIVAGDKTAVFTLPEAVDKLDKLFGRQ